jgi:hypothetical protein
MEIQISKTKRIITDELNWVYQEYVLMSKKTKKYEWKSIWWYSSIESIYFDLLEYFTRNSDKEKLSEAFKETVDMLDCIKKEIKKC